MSATTQRVAGARAAGPAGTTLAPYALVRLAALPYPPVPGRSGAFRRAMSRSIRLWTRLATTAPAVCDALYASAAGHSPRFHRQVVLPLRRDLHNRRLPRPALRAALADLPDRVPGLPDWLAAADELAEARAELVAAAPAALAAERQSLAATCRAEPLRCAAPLIGSDLLRGIDRAGAVVAEPDARARKAEPTVLRYALRATAKTSPLSWFTHVAWGTWAVAGQPELLGGRPVATARANRTLSSVLLGTVLDRAGVRDRVPHRLAPAIRVVDGRVGFRRYTPVPSGGQVLGMKEEEVSLGSTRPIQLLLALARAAGPAGVVPADLAAALAARLPDPAGPAAAAAAGYVGQVIDAGVLVPVEPIHPQAPDALTAVARWLERHGQEAHLRDQLPALLRTIEARTAAFGGLPAQRRGAALAELRDAWSAAFAVAGARSPGGPPLAEDVAVREPARLGRAHGRAAAADLPRLAALAELLDQYLPVRRMIRDRFVGRYGVAGECHHAAEFAAELATVWRAAGLVGLDGTIDDDAPDRADLLSPELRELAGVRASIAGAMPAPTDADEVWIPEEVVRSAARAVPGWILGRPASYSFFVQPAVTAAGTVLVVNHTYAGWGRFLSRFLDQVAPAAAAALARQLRGTLGADARVAQFRPVNGFNANLHPLVVADEVGEDPAWATIAADQISLCHDPAADQVRLRLAGSAEPLDVLYLGFLVPFSLPERLAHLHLDLGCGLVDFANLAPAREHGEVRVRPRLRYRDLVLARRTWFLPDHTVAGWRADLTADGDLPATAAARWAGRLGVPSTVFVGPARRAVPRGPEDFLRYLSQPKPQYVDLGNALHLRCLSRLLARHDGGVRLAEALPVPGTGNPDGRVVELVTETYRKAVHRA